MAHLDENGEIVLDAEDFESDANPYVKRFNDYRSDADRRVTEYQATQKQLADLTSDDPDTQRAAAEALGLTFIDEEEPAGAVDEPNQQLSALEQRIAAFEAKEAERERLAQESEKRAEVLNYVETTLTGLGITDEGEGNLIIARANLLPTLETGMPDLKAAHDLLIERDNTRFEGWRKSKRTAPIKSGEQATEQKAVHEMSDQERLDWALAKHEME